MNFKWGIQQLKRKRILLKVSQIAKEMYDIFRWENEDYWTFYKWVHWEIKKQKLSWQVREQFKKKLSTDFIEVTSWPKKSIGVLKTDLTQYETANTVMTNQKELIDSEPEPEDMPESEQDPVKTSGDQWKDKLDDSVTPICSSG